MKPRDRTKYMRLRGCCYEFLNRNTFYEGRVRGLLRARALVDRCYYFYVA